MGENSCYASLGKLLLLRVAAAASLAACVWAQDSDDHDHHHHHHNHGHHRGDERGTLVITILKFYALVTGVALVLLALGAIAFACCSVCCFRRGKGKGIVEGDSEAITNKYGNDDCKLGPRKVGGVICATLCWPVVVAGFGCTAVLKLGDTLKRCKVVGGRSNSEVGGSSAKEAAVVDSPGIDRDISEKTPPISVVEEGGIDSIELDFL